MQLVRVYSQLVMASGVYDVILTSPRLKRMVIPEGPVVSPYEVLDYRATLTLEDPNGLRATFRRSQRVRFLQAGVSALLDHFWGDGVPLVYYEHDAGPLVDWFAAGGVSNLVVGLKKPMARGETMSFGVTRTAMVAFTRAEEWLETRVDHPISKMSCEVIYPAERPCRRAVLRFPGGEVVLPVASIGQGRTRVRFAVPDPGVDTPYEVRWVW